MTHLAASRLLLLNVLVNSPGNYNACFHYKNTSFGNGDQWYYPAGQLSQPQSATPRLFGGNSYSTPFKSVAETTVTPGGKDLAIARNALLQSVGKSSLLSKKRQ